MARFHINPETGTVGECRAQKQCRFGSVAHYASAEEARQAYEQKQQDSDLLLGLKPAWDAWRVGKKLAKKDLNALPLGAVVQWPHYHEGAKTLEDWVKVSEDLWQCVKYPDKQSRSTYLAGAAGNVNATYVSGYGDSSSSLPPVVEKPERKKPEPKWAIVRYAQVSDRYFLAKTFTSAAAAEKHLQKINRYDYLHSDYQLLPYKEALKIVNV